MKKKNVLVVGVAVIAVLIYLWMKNKKAASTLTISGTPGVSGSPASSGVPVTAVTTNPVTGTSNTSWLAGNGTVQVPSAVQQWVQSGSGIGPNNQAQFMKMLPNMTQSDMNGLLDLIVNSWGKGAQPTQAQVQFWNNWRTAYHILDGTVSNFTGRPRTSQYGKRRAR